MESCYCHMLPFVLLSRIRPLWYLENKLLLCIAWTDSWWYCSVVFSSVCVDVHCMECACAGACVGGRVCACEVCVKCACACEMCVCVECACVGACVCVCMFLLLLLLLLLSINITLFPLFCFLFKGRGYVGLVWGGRCCWMLKNGLPLKMKKNYSSVLHSHNMKWCPCEIYRQLSLIL